MERLSVCYVNFSYYPGQGTAAFFEYSRALAKIGHEVHVIAAARPGEKTFEVVNKVAVQRTPVKTTRRLSPENLRFSYLARRALAAVIKMSTFDIVHIFSHAGSILIRFANKKTRGTKWIYDIRSGPVRKSPWSFLGKAVQGFESSFFDATFVVDKGLMESKSSDKVFLAPIGVNLQMFRPVRSRWVLSKHDIPESDVVLVYSGSLDPERRTENLIYAFWEASKVIKNLRLMVLGEGRNLGNLRSVAEKLAISDKVLFLGYVDYGRMPAFLSAADIAVSYVPLVPAFDKQPPLKTIEYLACSLPVIATETAGNRQFIAHEKNGLLTKDDPNSLSETIIRLSKDADLRATLSRNARPSVKNYDWKTIVEERILPAYKKILSK